MNNRGASLHNPYWSQSFWATMPISRLVACALSASCTAVTMGTFCSSTCCSITRECVQDGSGTCCIPTQSSKQSTLCACRTAEGIGQYNTVNGKETVEMNDTCVVMASHMTWVSFTAAATDIRGVASEMLKRRLYERAHSRDVIM